MVLEKKCNEFIQVLSSKEPIPGGGGASAYVGALGMSLGSMVGNLTLGKQKYQEVEPMIQSLLDQSKNIIAKLEELVERDAQAFLPLSQAYKMPKVTKEQQINKKAAIQQALIEAAQVPLEIARTCLKAIVLMDTYAKEGSRMAISDAGVGAIFCKAAIQAAKLNVLINTKMMEDQDKKARIESELDEIVTVGLEKANAIYQYVENTLKK